MSVTPDIPEAPAPVPAPAVPRPSPLADAPRNGTPIRATHWRKGEFVVRFDAQASRVASHGVWRGHGGSYDESDFEGWRPEAGD